MDVLAAVGGALMGAGIAAQVGYWIGRRDRRPRAPAGGDVEQLRAVAGAAQELVDSGWDIEVALDDGDDPEEIATFVGLWERLDRAVHETRSSTPLEGT